MMTLAPELRLAARHLRQRAGTFVSAALILSVGLGMSLAMLSVVTNIILRPPPIADPDHLIALSAVGRGADSEMPLDLSELTVVRQTATTLSDVAGVAHYGVQVFPVFDRGAPVVLAQARVTGNFFALLGTHSSAGRLLQPADDAVGAHAVAVLSFEAWRDHFGEDSTIIGRRLMVEDGVIGSYEIVGIAPPELSFPRGADYWVPITPTGYKRVAVIARERPGVAMSSASREFLALATSAFSRNPTSGKPVRVQVRTITAAIFGDLRPTIFLLTAAVAVLLLIACANVGNLLLLDASSRTREIAVRRALGASTSRIAVELLFEAIAIAVAGCVLGLLTASALLHTILNVLPPGLPRFASIGISTMPVWEILGVAALTIPLFLLYPAILVFRSDLQCSLRSDSRGGTESRERRWLRRGLVTAQVTLAVISLAAAGLFDRTYAKLRTADLGFNPTNFAILELSIDRYVQRLKADPTANATRYLDHMDGIYSAIRRLPTVIALSPVVVVPYRGPSFWSFRLQLEGETSAPTSQKPSVAIDLVGPEYITAVGTRLLRGRGFQRDDAELAPPVALVDSIAARELWPGENPIGKRVRLESDTGNASWRTVVGIVGSTRLRDVRSPLPTVLFPYRQWTTTGILAVRTSAPLPELLPSIRSAVRNQDSEIGVWRARTLQSLVAPSLAGPQLASFLLTCFGLAALLLSTVGLYCGLMAWVRSIRRELAIRMALGANPNEVQIMVVMASARLLLAGLIVGILVAVVASQAVSSMLFNVSPNDPWTLIGVAVTLFSFGLLATFVPARSASRVDPMKAMREA